MGILSSQRRLRRPSSTRDSKGCYLLGSMPKHLKEKGDGLFAHCASTTRLKMAPEGGLGHHRRCGMKVFNAFVLRNQSTFTTALPPRNHRATTGFSDTFSDSSGLASMICWSWTWSYLCIAPPSSSSPDK